MGEILEISDMEWRDVQRKSYEMMECSTGENLNCVKDPKEHSYYED